MTNVEPSTGETAATGEASTDPSAATAPTSPTTVREPLQYWQAMIALNDQQNRLVASDERFQEFARTNTWGNGAPCSYTYALPDFRE